MLYYSHLVSECRLRALSHVGPKAFVYSHAERRSSKIQKTPKKTVVGLPDEERPYTDTFPDLVAGAQLKLLISDPQSSDIISPSKNRPNTASLSSLPPLVVNFTKPVPKPVFQVLGLPANSKRHDPIAAYSEYKGLVI